MSSETPADTGRPDQISTTAPDAALTRRALLSGAAGVVGGALIASVPGVANGQGGGAATSAAPAVAADPNSLLGYPTSAMGARSSFEAPSRTPVGQVTGSSRAPLRELTGTITPSDLHFERHHAGVPALDPRTHRLMIHGLVERPITFTVDDIKRFPQVTRVHFLECSGNGRAAFKDPKPESTAQAVAGMSSNTEWTGVPLATLLREAGASSDATWFLAEGADACRMTRSVPMEKAWDDALIVWAQNGEPLRPAQGYPLRLLLPGWEGNISVKWLRRLELGTKPWMTRWETSVYTDPLRGGKARQFSFVQDAKSIITSPSFPDRIAAPGWQRVSGLAWSGRGRIQRVEVSSDNGTTWHDAELSGEALPKAHVRFQYMWNWQGEDATLLSRATDETGYVQPTRTRLIEVRGPGTDYHFNAIAGWHVLPAGTVLYHGAT
ncbi:MAG: sulfite dehydrogenase [Gemmatimonadaceae bacterium]